MKQVIASLVILTVLQGWGIRPAAAADQKKLTVPIQKISLQEISLTLNPNSVTGGAIVTGTLALKVPAPSGGLKVTFKSSKPAIAAVPSGTVVQAGATSATFIVQTYPLVVNPNVVADPPSVQISAQLGTEMPVTATLTVAPARLTGLTLNPATVGGGSTSTGTVTISGTAPQGGMTIALHSPSASSSPTPLNERRFFSPIGLPASVTITAGASFATFTITATVPGSYEIDASSSAFNTKSATLTVTAPQLASLKLQATTGWTDYEAMVTGGTPVEALIELTGKAAKQPINVYLNTDVETGGSTGSFARCGQAPSVPATISVPVGASSATFKVTTFPGYGTYGVGAGLSQNFTGWKTVALATMSPQFTIIVPSTAHGGSAIQGKIQLTGGATSASCGNRYTLNSSNTTYVQVPGYVDVTPGATEASFAVSSTALPASSANVTVTISATGTVVSNNAPSPTTSGVLQAGADQQTLSANLTITP